MEWLIIGLVVFYFLKNSTGLKEVKLIDSSGNQVDKNHQDSTIIKKSVEAVATNQDGKYPGVYKENPCYHTGCTSLLPDGKWMDKAGDYIVRNKIKYYK